MKWAQIWQTNLLWPMSPPFETPWQKTDSYMFPYHQWKPIQNGQLIRKYKKIPVQWQIDRYIETITQLDTIGRWPPSQASRDACHTTTPTTGSIAHIDTKGRWTPQSSKQRCLPLHYTNYWIYCTYRYQRQMDPPEIEHTKSVFFLDLEQWRYLAGRWSPLHLSSIDALHTSISNEISS